MQCRLDSDDVLFVRPHLQWFDCSSLSVLRRALSRVNAMGIHVDPHSKLQKLVSDALRSSDAFKHVALAKLGERLNHWAPDWSAYSSLAAELLSCLSSLPMHVSYCVVRTWCNAWITGWRFGNKGRRCLFHCSASETFDVLAHADFREVCADSLWH